MLKNRTLLLLLLLLSLTISACQKEPLVVDFDEIMDGGIARFTAHNNSEKDISSLKVEITYFSPEGKKLLVDSVSYLVSEQDGAGKGKPFLVAGEETFFMQNAPPGTASAKADVLKVIYTDK